MRSIAHRFAARLAGALALALFLLQPAIADFTASGKLEIHYINVGQGGCTLIIGPDGTLLLYDFGAVPGRHYIVPYLKQKLGLSPAQGIEYSFVSHRDKDHYVGYADVVKAGYGFEVANFAPDSSKAPSQLMKSSWLDSAAKTTAGAVREPAVGLRFALGDGAEAIVMAVNGKVYGLPKRVKIANENDRSIALLVRYREFRYLIDGDLGAGPEKCTRHDTNQVDVETQVARALIAKKLIDPLRGIDVLHIAHHGSESSTSAAYYNLMKPKVGLISVGLNQGTFRHPREDVVDKVLVGDKRAGCVTAPPLQYLFQTEDGVKGSSSTGRTSFSGLSIGNIKLTTDGQKDFEIEGDNNVNDRSSKEWPRGKVWKIPLGAAGNRRVPR